MDNQAKLLRRLLVLFVVLALCGGTAVAALFSLQMINGEEYRLQAERRLTSNMTVTASRGEILDRYGRPLVTNRTVFSLRLDYAYWDKEKQNQTILALARLVREDGAVVEDSLPISAEAPFTYIGEETDSVRETLAAYAEEKKLGAGLTADQMMTALRTYYKIDHALGDADARTIAGVRYEMAQTDFSLFAPFIFAHDISMDLVTKVKEQHKDFAGVDIETESVREYKTEYAAHILGRVGIIYREEWNGEGGYKEQGYSMNAIVGKDGMERVLEPYLRGKDGSRSVETNISGNVTGVISSEPPQPGNNCILTLDIELQQATEEALENTIKGISTAKTGAAVVVQVGTGEVLAMASYPTYKLATFNRDYDQLYNDPNKPMINRATSATYAPGSTFKPMVALAALEEGIISSSTTIYCNRVYDYFQGQRFTCTGYHGRLDAMHAIQKSCNIFFYETGRLLGGDKIEQWAAQFGLGQKTGIELSEASWSGAAGPAHRADMLENNPALNPWMPGDNVQAAIGQSDNAFTPVQMANYIATLASGGKHYAAHLLKSVKSYDYTQTIKDDTPTLLNTVEMSDANLRLVKEGMKAVVSEGGTAARIFRNYPIAIGGKSGTAQLGRDKNGNKIPNNGVFVAFAPYENPEIAICVVVEGGNSGSEVAPAVRDILDAYFTTEQAADNMLQPYTLVQ